MSTGCYFTTDHDVYIKQEYESGASLQQLAVKYITSEPTIKKVLQRTNTYIRNTEESVKLRAKNKCGCKGLFSEEYKIEIISKYKNNISCKELAKIYSCSIKTIQKILNKNNILIRKENPNYRKYTVDQYSFANIENNPEGCYWCGMIMADGCILKSGNSDVITFSLSGEDGKHVTDFKNFVKSNRPIKTKIPKSNFANAKEASYFDIVSSIMVQDLEKYGVIRNKTYGCKVRQLENNKYFWLGMICGDGWLYIDSKNSPVIGLCGCREIIEQFQNYIRSICETKANISPNGSVWKLEIKGKFAIQIIKILFENCDFALERKVKIAKNIIGETI